MSGPAASRRARIRTVAGSLALASTVLLAACGGGGGDDAEPRLGEVCDAVGIAHRRILSPAELTFADLVDDERWSQDELDAVATIRVVADGVDAGRFQPLVRHLALRHERQVDGEGREPPPTVDEDLRELARDLDDELDDGGCA